MKTYGNFHIFFFFILHWNDLTYLWKCLLEPFSLQPSGHGTGLAPEATHKALWCQLQAQNECHILQSSDQNNGSFAIHFFIFN